ncbi:hypothetical protein Tco_0937790 [Tanacetum coccineum]|uniref:Uncharacterized protein n=1 Tax=Tanacetum coccineum TaxID=301880 RepID=A0ABQ5DF92_9ASTR
MVNTRTDVELAAAVQASRWMLAPQIREQGSRRVTATGAVTSGSNPPQSLFHTWLSASISRTPFVRRRQLVKPCDAVELDLPNMERSST